MHNSPEINALFKTVKSKSATVEAKRQDDRPEQIKNDRMIELQIKHLLGWKYSWEEDLMFTENIV